MTETGNNDSERLIACSFCNEQVTTSSMQEHLLMCGNKTDECPRCRKFIRRAIFAYHYENNCANLDEIENNGTTDSAIRQPDASSSFPRYTPLQTTSGSTVTHNRQTTIVKIDLATHPAAQNGTSSRSDLNSYERKPTIILCPYCEHICEIGEEQIHRKYCLRNPENIVKKQQAEMNPTSNPSSDRRSHNNGSDDADSIPCEYCKEPIKLKDYREHTKACAERDYERILHQSRPVYSTDRQQDSISFSSRPYNREVNSLMVQCKYCDAKREEDMISIHEKVCIAAPDERYNSVYRLPSLQN